MVEFRHASTLLAPFAVIIVASTSAIDWLERLVSEMAYYVTSGMLSSTNLVIHWLSSNYSSHWQLVRALTSK